MCTPAAAVFGLQAGQQLLGFQAAQDASERNAENARESALAQYAALDRRRLEERESASQEILSVRAQAEQALSRTRVSAGEAGVAGASVQALFDDFQRQEITRVEAASRQLHLTERQLDEERRGVQAQERARLEAVPRPSRLNLLLGIAGSGLNALGSGPAAPQGAVAPAGPQAPNPAFGQAASAAAQAAALSATSLFIR